MTLGLLSRSRLSIFLPNIVSQYSGDILWAALVFFGFSIILTNWKVLNIGLVAIGFSFFIEFSQLYHAPWIDKIRNTTLGGLVLGFGFKASDLACYIIGVALGISISLFLSYFSRPAKIA